MADAVILLVIVLAVYWGLRRGLIRPLVSELVFVFALVLTGIFHKNVEALLPNIPAALISPVMVLILGLALGVLVRPVVALVRAVPFVARFDTWVGAVVHGALAFILLYLALGAMIDFDQHVYPLLQTGVVTAQEIERYRQAIAANPGLKGYSNDARLQQTQELAREHPIPLGAVRHVADALDWYVRYLRDPLLHSRLAPRINDAGAHIPIVGRPRPYLKPGTCVPGCDNQPAT